MKLSFVRILLIVLLFIEKLVKCSRRVLIYDEHHTYCHFPVISIYRPFNSNEQYNEAKNQSRVVPPHCLSTLEG